MIATEVSGTPETPAKAKGGRPRRVGPRETETRTFRFSRRELDYLELWGDTAADQMHNLLDRMMRMHARGPEDVGHDRDERGRFLPLDWRHDRRYRDVKPLGGDK